MTGITSDEETKNRKNSKTTTSIASLFHDSKRRSTATMTLKDGQPLPRKVAKVKKKKHIWVL